MSYTWDYLLTEKADPMYKGIAAAVTRSNAKNVLDLGCGYTRWLEHYTGAVSVTGVDNNIEAISTCKIRYPQQEFIEANCFEFDIDSEFDTIVLGGILYYCKGDQSPLEFVDRLVEKYGATTVIIQEPFPSVSYNSPDFIPLLDKYAWSAEWHSLDMRMGNRVIFELKTDRVRPERKIKVESDGNPFNDDILRYGVYTVNTEDINNSTDGLITPSNFDNTSYASVCAGFKSMYKGCLDYYTGKTFDYTWIDVSPTAVLYKMYQDMLLTTNPEISYDTLVEIYRKDYDSRIVDIRDPESDITKTVGEQLARLGITKKRWREWLDVYKRMPKRYIKCDLVNNPVYLREQIPAGAWFWYSNAFDWHQFRYTERSRGRWLRFMNKKGIECVGKNVQTPTLTKIKEYLVRKSDAQTYSTLYENTANYLWAIVGSPEATDFRENDYCMTIAAPGTKIKIYCGVNALIAKQSYSMSAPMRSNHAVVYEHNNCRIEKYDWVEGVTMDKLAEMPVESIRAWVNTILDQHVVVYPYDISPWNLVLTDSGNIEVIDWDYMIHGNEQDLKQKVLESLNVQL